MHPKTTKQTESIVLGPMGWIWCVRCKKSRRHFVARTFALIAPVHRVVHQVSCSNEMIPNATKQYEMDQRIRLESNGVDRVRSLRKILTRLRGTNFCINYTSPAPFCTKFRAIMKLSQMHPIHPIGP